MLDTMTQGCFTHGMAYVIALLLIGFVFGAPIIAARCFYGAWGFVFLSETDGSDS